MNRREFVCGAVCFALLPSGCASFPTISVDRQDDVLVASLADWPADQKMVLAKPREGAPVFLFRNGDEIRALSSTCTHKGCTVEPVEEILECPCHGAQFDHDGEVLKGPAKKPLPALPVKIEGELIYITIQRNF